MKKEHKRNDEEMGMLDLDQLGEVTGGAAPMGTGLYCCRICKKEINVKLFENNDGCCTNCKPMTEIQTIW